jgi:hypothetical protein
MTAPDPTAGEDHWTCGGCGHEGNGPDNVEWYEHTKVCPDLRPASPPAVAASTGTSEDVETQRRALEDWLIDNRWALEAYDFSHALMASDWLTAREAAARAEERERIAQAIEALSGNHVRKDRAARIAREGRG